MFHLNKNFTNFAISRNFMVCFWPKVNLFYYSVDHCNQEHPTAEKIASIEAKCQNCNINFFEAEILNQHLTTCVKDLKQFQCEKCKKVKKDPLECEFWHSAAALRKHIAEKHNLILTICEICGALLKSKYYLEDHKKSVHEKVKNFACNYCGKGFASRRHELILHQNTIISRNL